MQHDKQCIMQQRTHNAQLFIKLFLCASSPLSVLCRHVEEGLALIRSHLVPEVRHELGEQFLGLWR